MSHSILASMLRIPPSHLDLTSVREVAFIAPGRGGGTAVKRTQAQILIIARKEDGSVPTTQQVTHDGEELVPYRLLPDDQGVEMRGQYICEYWAASEGYIAEVAKAKKERKDAIAHCEKLLIDLPVALSNSRTAMDAVIASADADLSEVGTMTIEQKRIRQEIAELESSSVPKIEKSEFSRHRKQTSVELQFGANRLGDQFIQVMRAPGAVTRIIDTPSRS